MRKYLKAKNEIKQFIYLVLNMFNFFYPRNRAAILLYHDIGKNNVYLTVSPDDFSRQMKYLKDYNYNVISLASLRDLIANHLEIPSKTAVLTFDDGLKSHFSEVLPILEKYQFPATFFTAINFLGGKINNSENYPLAAMDEEELKLLGNYPLADLEPHTLSHRELTNLPFEEIETEISESKNYLEKLLGKKCEFFAFPRGKYDNRVLSAVKKFDFKMAVTVEGGLVAVENDLFILPRNTINSQTGMQEFKGKLSFASVIFNFLCKRESQSVCKERCIRLLSFSLDGSNLNQESLALKRQEEYAGLCEEFHLVVFGNGKSQHKSNISIYSVAGGSKITKFFRAFFLANRIIKKNKLNLISSQAPDFIGFLSYLLAKKNKVKLEVQVHGFEKFRGIRKWVAKFVLPRADSVRTVSQRLKRQLISDFGVKNDRITVVPICVDLGFTNYDLRIKNNNGKFIFLTAGRLVPVKNIGMQIEAMTEVIKKYSQAELWIAGDGPERKRLEDRAKRLEVSEAVKFLGWQKELEQFYEKADVFLLTSNAEGWGMVVVEAASYGLPIIMTDVGSAGELIINNENGLVIPVGGGQALEETMIKLIEDSDLKEKLGKSARQVILNQPGKEEILALYKKSWERALEK